MLFPTYLKLGYLLECTLLPVIYIFEVEKELRKRTVRIPYVLLEFQLCVDELAPLSNVLLSRLRYLSPV